MEIEFFFGKGRAVERGEKKDHAARTVGNGSLEKLVGIRAASFA